MSDNFSLDIAVVGLSVRLPGSRNHGEYWDHLMAGRELVSFFPEEEILRDYSLLSDPLYIRAAGILPDHDRFDAGFFGVSPAMAAMMSPEHRQFLEAAWEALEDAGYSPERCAGEVGVYGACNPENIARYRPPPEWLSGNKLTTELAGGWSPDSLTPNVLYYLGLTGEAMTVSSYCAGFHYAAHLACQSLILRQIDLALAGCVAVRVPQRRGYLHVPGAVMSRDGRTRPFDAQGTGSVPGSGVVAVALKRLDDALAARDHVYAVIKGSAFNNNGSQVIQYGAPQPERLAQCVAAAMAGADIDPATVSLVECYGIGHPLSDVLEVDALRRAFRGVGRRSCALGSVKGNIGHCSTAAGGSAFAKAVLALGRRQLPATLHFDTPNPQLRLDETPFHVLREASAWEPACGILRAGVTALGGSGHNAHIVLEEAPPVPSRGPGGDEPQIVVLSARDAAALARMQVNLGAHLRRNPGLALTDVAWTLNTGRRTMEHRWAALARSTAELVEQLEGTTCGLFVGESVARAGDGSGSVTTTSAPGPGAAQAEAWLRGQPVDWDERARDRPARRVSLPTYPFARERHWLDSGQAY